MSVYSLASKFNSVQIEVKSKASKNNPAFTGNITTTNGNITATNGTVSGAIITSTSYLAVTGAAGIPQVPPEQGCFIGSQNGGHVAIELASANGALAYIDFSQVNSDFKGRIMYSNANSDFTFSVNTTLKMTLNSAGLSVVVTVTPSSDNRLKFNEKPIINALAIIKQIRASWL